MSGESEVSEDTRQWLFRLNSTGMALFEIADVLGLSYETAKRLKEQGLCCNGGSITPNCKGCKQ